MANNRGKAFEKRFSEDWEHTFPGELLIRIPDQQSGYKFASSNVSDFIAYTFPYAYLIEVKSITGNTFPFTYLRQYDALLSYKGKKGLHVGVVLWFIDHDHVIWAPIEEIEKMKIDGKKSINIKMLNSDEYKLTDIPSKKKRVFMESDYSILYRPKED